jgi:hypothetical protein
MEVAGFVIGAVGLVGLYGNCLQFLDQIDAARHLKEAANPLFARFAATKHLFREWGTVNGIKDGKLITPHHPVFDDDSARRVIFLLLANIENIMADQNRLCERYGMSMIPLSTQAPTDVDGMRLEMSKIELNRASKGLLLRARWAVADHKKFSGLVGELEVVVDRLFKLAMPQATVPSDDLTSKLNTLKSHINGKDYLSLTLGCLLTLSTDTSRISIETMEKLASQQRDILSRYNGECLLTVCLCPNSHF